MKRTPPRPRQSAQAPGYPRAFGTAALGALVLTAMACGGEVIDQRAGGAGKGSGSGGSGGGSPGGGLPMPYGGTGGIDTTPPFQPSGAGATSVYEPEEGGAGGEPAIGGEGGAFEVSGGSGGGPLGGAAPEVYEPDPAGGMPAPYEPEATDEHAPDEGS